MATTASRQSVSTHPNRKRRFTLTPYLFVLPHLFFFALFLGYPFFYGLYISAFQYDFLRPEANRFVGIRNYLELFTAGSVPYQIFWNAFGNTMEFVLLSVPPLVILPLLLAILLNTRTPGRNIFRAIYFSPWVLSAAVVGLLGFWIFQSQGGLVNYYLDLLGVDSPRWLSSMPWAWISILIITLWWTNGFNMVIFLAALQAIPNSIYEAASIDGATGFQSFLRITLPLLRPVLIFIIVITIIASFNLFAQPFFMTGGGPAQATGGGATEPVMLRIYRQGFERNQMGSAAAMSFTVATIMMIFSYINFRLFRTRDDE
jgi:multiple sugar transport system permease protein